MASKKINQLNVFLSNAAVMNIKIHNLHWNVVGPEFIVVHTLTEKLYKMFQEQFDTVAELMKMQNELPMANMADYLKTATVEEIESRDYSTYEVLQMLDEDCDNIMDLAKQIRDEADKKDNFLVANLFEDYLAVYAKHSWMIKAMLQDEDIALDEDEDNEEDTEEE